MSIAVTERLRVHVEGGSDDPRGAATKEAMVAQVVIEIANQTAEHGSPPQFGRIGAV